MRKLMATISSAAVALSTFTSSAFAADAAFVDLNYPGGRATSYVVKVVAEQRLGLEIEMVQTSAVPVIWQAMDRGKGEIDVLTEVWLPNQQALADKFVKEKGTITLGSKPYQASQGLCVTRVTKDKYGISSVYDLLSADNAKLFDTNGDGKGEMYIGPSGWISTNVEKVRARDYGYGEVFELQIMEEAAALANLDAAITKGKPFVFFCYKPHHSFKIYDLVLLEEPAHDPAKFKFVGPDEATDWYEQSMAETAWYDINVYVAYSKTLKQRTPTLAQLLDNVQFDSDAVSDWIYEIGINGREPQEVAEEWVANNPDIVDGWVQ